MLRKQLGAMMHGVLCFAIFFSFVGTVLGGLVRKIQREATVVRFGGPEDLESVEALLP